MTLEEAIRGAQESANRNAQRRGIYQYETGTYQSASESWIEDAGWEVIMWIYPQIN